VSLETKEPVRSARRDATRERVLDAAREVFAERGVFGATVEEICERAGFTRGAFYSNFTDKDDVVGAVIEREHDRLLAHLDASVAELSPQVEASFDLPEALAALMGGVLASIPVDRQLSLIQTELEIFAVRRPDQAARFLEVNTRFRERVGAFLDDALRQHGRELVVDPVMLTDAIVAIAERSVRRSLLAGDDDPDALSRAVLPGILLAFSRPTAAP
jgi:AcrR family transcriptional regulator